MLKVMVVDDEPVMRLVISELIDWEQNGFELLPHASNGAQAIDRVRTEMPDIIITDIQMPEMDGVEMIKYLYAHYPKIKTIVLSNYDEFSYVKEVLLHGAADYILKAKISAQSLLALLGKIKRELISSGAGEAAAERARLRDKLSLTLRRNQMMRELCDGTLQGADVPAYNSEFDLGLRDAPYYACCILADGMGATRAQAEREQKDKLTGVLDAILREVCTGGVELCRLHSGRYVALIHQPEGGQIHELRDQIDRFQNLAHRYSNIRFTVGISARKQALSSLDTACAESLDAALNRFYTGPGQIHFAGDSPLTQEDLTLKWINKEMIANLKRVMQKGDVSTAGIILQDYFQEIRSARYHANSVRTFVVDYLILLRNLVLEHIEQCDELNLGSDYIHEQMAQCEGCDEVLAIAQRQIQQLEKNLREYQLLRYGAIVNQAVAYLRTHYAGDVTLTSLAQHLHVNSSYLSRVFQQKTGRNFVDYLSGIRIETAKQLLKTTDLNIAEITERVGFTNPKYFGKVFKRACGITPHAYREQ